MNEIHIVGIGDGFKKMLAFIAKPFLGCLTITIYFILFFKLTNQDMCFFFHMKKMLKFKSCKTICNYDVWVKKMNYS